MSEEKTSPLKPSNSDSEVVLLTDTPPGKRKRLTLDAFVSSSPNIEAQTKECGGKAESEKRAQAPSGSPASKLSRTDADIQLLTPENAAGVGKSPRGRSGGKRSAALSEAKRREQEEERQRKRLEKERERAEKEAKKEAERRAKEQERYVKQKERERQRQAKEEEARIAKEKKEAEKAAKEAEKAAKEAEKAAAKEAKDAEKRRREEEARREEAAAKARLEKMKISNFFGSAGSSGKAGDTSPTKISAGSSGRVSPEERGGDGSGWTGFLASTKPLELKTGMRIAPSSRRPALDSNQRLTFDHLFHVQEGSKTSYFDSIKTQPVGKASATITDSADESSNSIQSILTNGERKEKYKAKLLQFHEDYRPAYFGTWRKRSANVSGRHPFAKDSQFLNYEVDSEAEWESEPEGEECESGDEEEEEGEEGSEDEEDGWMVPHGHLSDDEGEEDEVGEEPEARRQRMALEAEAWKAAKSGPLIPNKLHPIIITPASTEPHLCRRLQEYQAIRVPVNKCKFEGPIKTAFSALTLSN